MYKFSDNQLKFSDFGQPVGMKMNSENRWVKKASEPEKKSETEAVSEEKRDADETDNSDDNHQ